VVNGYNLTSYKHNITNLCCKVFTVLFTVSDKNAQPYLLTAEPVVIETE